MEELEIGEYVRSKKGYIAKIKDIICKGYPIKSLEGYIICNDEDGTIINPNEVIKHSKIISEVVEVGDYVNGKLIHKIDKGPNYCYLYYGNCKTFVSNQIREILTKEQYMQNCYKVEEEKK